MHEVLMPITILSARLKRLRFLEAKTKQVADEEFTDSVEPGWLIWRADVSSWPLLFLDYLHR
jgi:hypothetical protein